MFKDKKEIALHDLFLISIILKGFNGLFQVILGVIIFIIKKDILINLVQKLFQISFIQKQTNFLTILLVDFSEKLSSSTVFFFATYLIIRGIIKIIMFLGLYYKKIWIYPLSGILSLFFTIYQLFRFLRTNSIVLLFSATIDIGFIFLLNNEYKKIKLQRELN